MGDLDKTKGIDLGQLTLERLERMLRNELYIDIDSPFADELIKEINTRKELINA